MAKNSNEEYLKFVIVGHVDHGKSTLIGRLLYDTDSLPEEKVEEIRLVCEMLGKDMEFGYVMDHLEEERDQGITIDTAQVWFNTDKRNYVIIDAPGHVEFVKNMITGASQAEAAILIVDADEGVKEQTKRHAYILSMLGLEQVIVVINKMDLVDFSEERFIEVKKELIHFLENIGIEPSYVLPISASKGDNVAKRSEEMNWYKGMTVLQALDTFEVTPSANESPMRFVVQDVYNFTKRIIVGRVESGIIHKGDNIIVLPSGEETVVASIEEFLAEPTEAETGRATGITTRDKLFFDRGNVVCMQSAPDQLPVVTDTIKARIFWMDKTPFTSGDSIYFRCATQEVTCSVEINSVMNSSTLEPVIFNEGEQAVIKNREVAEVTIKTTKPIAVDNFNEIQTLGRFVLGYDDTCAGGIITEL
ncbi:sulfate adenylyltransferase subunit 1 [Methanogenium organophilum]|uniref:sulfate adenylyltransferase n=1 Tax=Methanogenium organophilum TaxID=2199 RepID=A0A9X9S3S6_METOG|nr:GTP-binding protein [Methanogenium organophilum]WAI01217.1 GTP-binding protein [Methanogenium organophilum]